MIILLLSIPLVRTLCAVLWNMHACPLLFLFYNIDCVYTHRISCVRDYEQLPASPRHNAMRECCVQNDQYSILAGVATPIQRWCLKPCMNGRNNRKQTNGTNRVIVIWLIFGYLTTCVRTDRDKKRTSVCFYFFGGLNSIDEFQRSNPLRAQIIHK